VAKQVSFTMRMSESEKVTLAKLALSSGLSMASYVVHTLKLSKAPSKDSKNG
jgi:hypothetical protein